MANISLTKQDLQALPFGIGIRVEGFEGEPTGQGNECEQVYIEIDPEDGQLVVLVWDGQPNPTKIKLKPLN
jgi:hypothetical protein